MSRDSPVPIDSCAVVALGSNQGDPRRQIEHALARLASMFGENFRASSLWYSSPVDCPVDSPGFINAVCLFRPAPPESPESLLHQLQSLEREFGRQPKEVLNEPRPLDLDLIVFGPETRSTPTLTLPHPRAHLRRFVLEPLNELAPGLHPPGWTATVRQTLRDLRTDEVTVPLASWTPPAD